MESCPGKVIAETEDEVWQLMELHAKIAHDEDASEWDDETRSYLKTLIKTV
jgi:predicted small metal-binding protein